LVVVVGDKVLGELVVVVVILLDVGTPVTDIGEGATVGVEVVEEEELLLSKVGEEVVVLLESCSTALLPNLSPNSGVAKEKETKKKKKKHKKEKNFVLVSIIFGVKKERDFKNKIK